MNPLFLIAAFVAYVLFTKSATPPAAPLRVLPAPAPAALGAGLGSSDPTQLAAEQFSVQALSAVPILGPALSSVAGGILSQINAHHQAALAAEGKALNDAIPRAIQTFGLIMQGVIARQITKAQAQTMADQVVDAYYGEVKNIIRGRWPFDADPASKHPPNPCNGACSVGHFHIERNRAELMTCVTDSWNGGHGVCDFPQVNAYATQRGFPHTSFVY